MEGARGQIPEGVGPTEHRSTIYVGKRPRMERSVRQDQKYPLMRCHREAGVNPPQGRTRTSGARRGHARTKPQRSLGQPVFREETRVQLQIGQAGWNVRHRALPARERRRIAAAGETSLHQSLLCTPLCGSSSGRRPQILRRPRKLRVVPARVVKRIGGRLLLHQNHGALVPHRCQALVGA